MGSIGAAIQEAKGGFRNLGGDGIIFWFLFSQRGEVCQGSPEVFHYEGKGRRKREGGDDEIWKKTNEGTTLARLECKVTRMVITSPRAKKMTEGKEKRRKLWGEGEQPQTLFFMKKKKKKTKVIQEKKSGAGDTALRLEGTA